MKRIILFLFFVTIASAQVTSLSSTFKLARWNAGNKLNAGTIGDTAQSNASLNYNFDRIDALIGRQINNKGLFTTLYGDSSANLNIGLYNSNHTRRLVFNDSIYAYYNAQFAQNVLITGNLFLGGYVTLDSVVTNGDLWIQGGLGVGGNATFYDTTAVLSDFSVGAAGVTKGYVDFYAALSFGRIRLAPPDVSIGGSLKTLYIPSVTDGKTLGTIDGNQNFTDVGGVTADSVQTDNNYTVLYSDTKIAGSSAGDTSANFTTFINSTNANETKVRFTYLHRRGVANIKAYYQIKGTNVAAVGTKVNVYTLAGVLVTSASNTSTATTTYEEDSNALPVSQLTSNQLYEVRFIGYGSDASDIPTITTVTIVATSN